MHRRYCMCIRIILTLRQYVDTYNNYVRRGKAGRLFFRSSGDIQRIDSLLHTSGNLKMVGNE